mmetsp:Transcript_25823/g.75281  ORF Transcript_25823/g.75281 Transcript_25823/m.75281 type:complete len:237 (-) Transcript_25823:449-1159(-)
MLVLLFDQGPGGLEVLDLLRRVQLGCLEQGVYVPVPILKALRGLLRLQPVSALGLEDVRELLDFVLRLYDRQGQALQMLLRIFEPLLVLGHGVVPCVQVRSKSLVLLSHVLQHSPDLCNLVLYGVDLAASIVELIVPVQELPLEVGDPLEELLLLLLRMSTIVLGELETRRRVHAATAPGSELLILGHGLGEALLEHFDPCDAVFFCLGHLFNVVVQLLDAALVLVREGFGVALQL